MNFSHKLVRPDATTEKEIESTKQKIAQLQQQHLILEQQHTPAEDASVVLPPGWEIIMEGNTQYYYQKSTGNIQTKIPTLPPPPPPPKPIMSPGYEVLTVGNTTWYRNKYNGDLQREFPHASAYEISEIEKENKKWLEFTQSVFYGRGGTKNKRKQSKRKNK